MTNETGEEASPQTSTASVRCLRELDESQRPACPVCGGKLMDIRRKLCCTRCHSIIETCCD